MEYTNDDLNKEKDSPQIVYVERRRGGCFSDGLKVGCGFILGFIVSIFLMVFYFSSSGPLASKINDLEDIDEIESVNKEIRYFQVRSKKGKATIHTGMSKDSVILLLGQPTEFTSTDYIDNITYRYGEYNSNALRIGFEKGKVSDVTQY